MPQQEMTEQGPARAGRVRVLDRPIITLNRQFSSPQARPCLDYLITDYLIANEPNAVRQCPDCWHAGEGQDDNGNPWPVHCGNCSCCRVCAAHNIAGCPLCND